MYCQWSANSPNCREVGSMALDNRHLDERIMKGKWCEFDWLGWEKGFCLGRNSPTLIARLALFTTMASDYNHLTAEIRVWIFRSNSFLRGWHYLSLPIFRQLCWIYLHSPTRRRRSGKIKNTEAADLGLTLDLFSTLKTFLKFHFEIPRVRQRKAIHLMT